MSTDINHQGHEMNEDSTTELILSELRSIRDDINTYTRSSGERLAKLEAGQYNLLGNGQPGRVGKLEEAVKDLTSWKTTILGMASGLSVLVSVAAWVFVEVLKH